MAADSACTSAHALAHTDRAIALGDKERGHLLTEVMRVISWPNHRCPLTLAIWRAASSSGGSSDILPDTPDATEKTEPGRERNETAEPGLCGGVEPDCRALHVTDKALPGRCTFAEAGLKASFFSAEEGRKLGI